MKPHKSPYLGIIILSGCLAGAILGSVGGDRSPPVPARIEDVAVRSEALAFGPAGGLKGMTSTDDLARVLWITEPRWRIPKTNYLLHALRLWRTSATFDDDGSNPYGNGVPSGRRMLEVLLDSREAKSAGVEPYPFLYRSGSGVSVQYEAGGCGIAHHDQYLMVMGELGLPSDTIIRLPDGSSSSLREVVRNSLKDFDIGQELEFTAVAYSRWLPPTSRWVDKHGDLHSFDEIAEALLRRPPDKTSCCGSHTPYALVNLLRANELYPILSPEVVRRVESYMARVSRQLEENQDEDGAWLGRWYASKEPMPDEPVGFQAIWATGHHLEWIALAPGRLRPNRGSIGRAARLLARLIPGHTITTVSQSYPPFSHAARALALMEEIEPSTLVASGRGQGRPLNGKEAGR